jgi:thiol-disulfide isomerase/thioredoxin
MNFLFSKLGAKIAGCLICAAVFTVAAAAQSGPAAKTVAAKTAATKLPKITQINEAALKKLLKPDGKPLLVNFWATWCDPCRDEFPDLVQIDADYKGRIDFITVSLDDLAEIDRDVPKFLSQMKAEMPAYLLKSVNEDAAIALVSPDWKGGLPYSILIGTDGKIVYTKQGKVSPPSLRLYLDRALAASQTVE